MAGDWVKIVIGLEDEPEVIAMASSLNIDRFSVVGRLASVWGWANQHSADGYICNQPEVTLSFLDSRTGVTGFGLAMVSVGWLEEYEGGIRFPKFDIHNSNSAKSRATTRNKVKEWRKRKPKDGYICNQSEVTSSSLLSNSSSLLVSKGGVGGKSKLTDADARATDSLPSEFQSAVFVLAWADWVAHRKEIGHELKRTAKKAQFAEFVSLGVERSLATIRHSIKNGWQGLFEPKEKTNVVNRESSADQRRREQRAKEFPEPYRPLPRLNPPMGGKPSSGSPPKSGEETLLA